MRVILIGLLIVFASFVQGQDTIRLMHYNLLNYGNYWNNCTSSNNNVEDKNEYLKTIVDYVQPDILTVNEISDDSYYHQLILTEALNTGGINYFAKTNLPNYSNSPIMNQVYYNTQKFNLVSNTAIQTNYRDIDIVNFSINDPGNGDDIFLFCAVAHLKASQGYEEERGYEANQLMNYLNNAGATGNYTFSGDFNVYTASEPAIQNLLFYPNEDIRFYDPINQLGSWNNNNYYAAVHTQSTHVSSSCAAGGGMDDRFDFILISDEIKDGTDKIQLLEGSYQAVGQDGQHYNQSLLSAPTNTSVPDDVLNALYNMSDHLPVVIDLVVGDETGYVRNTETNFDIVFNNPVNGQLNVLIKTGQPSYFQLDLTNPFGQLIFTRNLNITDQTEISVRTNNLKEGFYLLKLANEKGMITTHKIIVLH
ncbi:MAG: T9SS type A sorting domain-containing protein [Bacteroidales bacterium]|nr:T9SS type A sorting domain-containing protein [Bacteroidales bacterium]